MSTFVLRKMETVAGRLHFFALHICKKCPFDGICKVSKEEAIKKYECELGPWDIFADGLVKRNPNFKKQLITVYSRIDSLAQLQTLPKNKFKDITPPKDNVKEYEIKTPDLRVYLFHLEHLGRVIICGGIKGTQNADIRQFRNLKRDYLLSLKKKNK
jgi:putative component of toxin-antitoxin plasmid stabilization module